MRRALCSQCYGDPEYRTEYGVKCLECSGIGSFEHWKNGQAMADIERELSATRQCLEEAEKEAADPSNSSQIQAWEERVAYWKYRIQQLSLDKFECES